MSGGSDHGKASGLPEEKDRWKNHRSDRTVPGEVKHLRVVNLNLTIDCPYVRREVPASVCFTGQRAPTHPYCFQCPDGQEFEEKLQARTFVRVVAPSHTPDNPVWMRVRVNSKKYGIKYTYAKYKEGKVTYPFNETVIDPRMSLPILRINDYRTIPSPHAKEHHGVLPDERLKELAEGAAQERKNMRRGVAPTGAVSGGKKKMIGKEMAGLIADRKKRDMSRYFPNSKIPDRDPVSVKKSSFPSTQKKVQAQPPQSIFGGAKRKAPQTTASIISGTAKKLMKKAGV